MPNIDQVIPIAVLDCWECAVYFEVKNSTQGFKWGKLNRPRCIFRVVWFVVFVLFSSTSDLALWWKVIKLGQMFFLDVIWTTYWASHMGAYLATKKEHLLLSP